MRKADLQDLLLAGRKGRDRPAEAVTHLGREDECWMATQSTWKLELESMRYTGCTLLLLASCRRTRKAAPGCLRVAWHDWACV